jgi:hypothetical protein
MIYNQWYVILESKELKGRKPLRVKRFNENLTLWRNERLIMGDKPIIEYRKHRNELIESQQQTNK